MKKTSATLLASLMLYATLGVPAFATPGGCLKYGAAGAVAGHVAHHHAILGATGGCALGMYKRHEYKKHQRETATQSHYSQ